MPRAIQRPSSSRLTPSPAAAIGRRGEFCCLFPDTGYPSAVPASALTRPCPRATGVLR